MKLKKTLYQLLDNDKGYDNAGLGDKIEQIADEFAIGFAEWLIDLKENKYAIYAYSSSKEVLEIYKKEKGL